MKLPHQAAPALRGISTVANKKGVEASDQYSPWCIPCELGVIECSVCMLLGCACSPKPL